MSPPSLTHLDPSSLGTKSYWDTAYTRELTNFADTGTDEGTIWFSDADAEDRVLGFLEDLEDEGELRKEDDDEDTTEEKRATRFLDLGTGNGHLLFSLREAGWCGDMVGVDYSPQSVELARQIRDSKGEEYADIKMHEFDILSSTENPPEWLGEGFDVVLDKGTFDAICLSEETDAQGRRICEGYRERVERLVRSGGRFLVTSCNWTGEELRGWFGAEEGGELRFEREVKYPSFRFGGKEGQKVASVCFRKGE